MWVFLCSSVFLIGVFQASGTVVLIGNNVNVFFENTESSFAPLLKGSEKRGVLYAADPLDACSPLTNKVISKLNDTRSSFVLIIRGGCSFEDKVRSAQAAGFRAVIVYDNENGALIAMAGHSIGINITAVFVSKISGETLRDYANIPDMGLWIVPSFPNTAWSIMGISFISLLAMCAVVVSCFFVRRRHIRRERPRAPCVQEFYGMCSRLVKAMPSVIFTAELEDNCTSKDCTICLEDYIVGEKLRILPCCHKFHANCVDTWLTSWRTFCPICKRDARSCAGNPPSSESTPLLSALVSSSPPLSPYRSSLATSSATEFGHFSSLPPSVSHLQSASETHFNQLHHQNTAQTALDLSSQRSRIDFIGNYPPSPPNSRYPTPYPPGNGSYMDYVNRLP